MLSSKLSNVCNSCKHAAPKPKGLNPVAAFLGIIVTWDSGNRVNGSYEVYS